MTGTGSDAVGEDKVKGSEFDPPSEFVTVTEAVPGNAESAAKIAAVNCVALTNVVARAEPFQFTIASLVRFVPFTVSVNPLRLQ